ncbi:fucolectin-1-like [Pseudophryne corroboree]|uniref:fucolectin-1-like n=1 Tax=Pseudophryne corroboree TaxID=495146 RepID=UPI0030816E39
MGMYQSSQNGSESALAAAELIDQTSGPQRPKMQIFLLVTVVAGALRQSQCCNPNPQGINLARDGQVVQSSLYNGNSHPEKAVDGNRYGDFSRGSCIHTGVEANPWWRLEFRKLYKIGTIIVANRQDCCAFQLVGAEVRVGNSLDNNNPVCGVITDADHITTLCCNGMEGRYVSVVIPGVQRVLHVCEVEVYEQDQESNYVCW